MGVERTPAETGRRRATGRTIRVFVIVAVVFGAGLLAYLVPLPAAHAYPIRAFDAKHLLDSADLVFHGKVVSVGPSRIEKDSSCDPPQATGGGRAQVRLVNLIKGEGRAAPTITVVFRQPTEFVIYTPLAKDEECILFLRADAGRYRFVDDHNGKLRIPPHEALRYESESAEGRMVEELVYATRMDTGSTRLVCIEELGRFRNEAVAEWLKVLATFKDMPVQGVAYAALIRLDLPPDAAELARFFARDDDTRSGRRFRTTGYSNGHLKGAILIRLNSRFNVIRRDFDLRYTGDEYVARRKAARTAATRWKDFDLIGFLNSAPWQERDTSSVLDNRVIAEIVGNQIDMEGRPAFISRIYREGSREIVVRLLGNENRHIRFAAARAIDKMIAEPHDFPYPRKRKAAGIDEYVTACRDWLAGRAGWGEW